MHNLKRQYWLRSQFHFDILLSSVSVSEGLCQKVRRVQYIKWVANIGWGKYKYVYIR